MTNPYFCKSLEEALRHPLFNNDREEFMRRQYDRELKDISRRRIKYLYWMENISEQPF